MSKKTAPPEIQIKDQQGRQRTVKLRAVTFGPTEIKKNDMGVGDATSDQLDVAVSREEEELKYSSIRGKDRVVAPPYNLKSLVRLRDNSTELGQNIDALVTNVVGFGWQLRQRPMPEAMRQQFAQEIELEHFKLKAQLDTVHPILSLTQLRKKALHDKHLVGNGYLELIENERGELVGINHVHGHAIRLTTKDKQPTMVEVPRIRPDQNFQVEQVPMFYRFRRFVMKLKNNKAIWFKEAGDPRMMDKNTGKFIPQGQTIPLGQRATSLIHDRVYHPMTPYGCPLYIGNTLSILGSRSADEVNYNTLKSNAIPSAIISVEGGQLTEGSIERIQQWTEEQIQKTQNYSKFLLLEAEPSEDGIGAPGQFRIKVEPMKRLQQQDELFQQYDSNNRDKIRQAFRLPPIFVGRADDYTRATADTSRDIADEQIFDPERTDVDHLINRFVLSRWGARFHVFRSRTPNVTDDIELIRLMAIGEKSGAITPRRADRIIRDVFGDDIGPMPKGVDLDTPFMLQFAQAQGGGGIGGRAPGPGSPKGSSASSVVEGLINLRASVEKAIEGKVLEGFDDTEDMENFTDES